MLQNGMNIICVSVDPPDIDGNDKKLDPDDIRSNSVHSSDKPSASTDNSYNSEIIHRNVGCDNDAYERSDELEISEL